eukprot:CAMPEP_0116028300 /NCGR_PEP_ID=MMETSP0321-20121206/15302_1 /TAXON_ID=163516 /ORGANISM="Leptocylindrus danicus var. danicus, Strain B650" /LENGTH=278 /DNA_ID=CAMNT_0003502139 /DNA_START=24 /DNA_END=860 /DNA_ORIENTATION=-
MASSGSGYDLNPSTFSPDGRIFQVEYASKAVDNAGTALGIQCSDGIVVCVEKPKPTAISKMLVQHSMTSKRVHPVSQHCGLAFTGLASDARQLVNRAKEEAANYKDTYGSEIPPKILADRMSAYVHYFTLHGSLRPFGATTLIAGYDVDLKEHALYMVEPSGVAYQYHGCAAGKGRQSCKTELEKVLLSSQTSLESTTVSVTSQEAVKQLARMIQLLQEDSNNKDVELEMGWVCAESGWNFARVGTTIVDEALVWAKADIEAAEEEDDDEDDENDMEE